MLHTKLKAIDLNSRVKDASIFQGIKQTENGIQFRYNGAEMWEVYEERDNAWLYEGTILAARSTTLKRLVKLCYERLINQEEY